MKKLILLTLCFCACLADMAAQKKKEFYIIIPEGKVAESKYNQLYFIDSRPPADNMGTTYINSWHGTGVAVEGKPMFNQLDSLIRSVTDTDKEGRVLAIQLRAFEFDCTYNNRKPIRKCHLRMSLYEKDNDYFYFKNTLDTLITDNTKENMEVISSVMTDFIVDNLTQAPNDGEGALTQEDVDNIGRLEQDNTPLFTASTLPDGIYNTYRSLAQLQPDISDFEARLDEDEPKDVRIPDPLKDGKTKKVKAQNVYALVKDGVPYISHNKRFLKLHKEDGEWKFTGTQPSTRSRSVGVQVAMANGGLLGFGIGMALGAGSTDKVLLVIDHLNGNLLFEKIIK